MDAKSNMFIKKIKLIESLSIRENVGIFDFLSVLLNFLFKQKKSLKSQSMKYTLFFYKKVSDASSTRLS